ncbi:MAG: hypothetical protein ACR2GN_00815 [Bacteroidia bacterium]
MMANFRQTKISLFILPLYLLVAITGIYTHQHQSVLPVNPSNAVVQSDFADSQPEYITINFETNLLPATQFSPFFVLKNLLSEVKSYNSYFLHSVQKTVQYPSCDPIYLFNRVLIH